MGFYDDLPFPEPTFYMLNSKHEELIKDAVLGFNQFHGEDRLSKLESISFDIIEGQPMETRNEHNIRRFLFSSQQRMKSLN